VTQGLEFVRSIPRPASTLPPTRRQPLSVLAWLREVNFMPATARAKKVPSESLPLEERIRRRAYELYVQRGNESGSELDDWLHGRNAPSARACSEGAAMDIIGLPERLRVQVCVQASSVLAARCSRAAATFLSKVSSNSHRGADAVRLGPRRRGVVHPDAFDWTRRGQRLGSQSRLCTDRFASPGQRDVPGGRRERCR
jgi:hypothetical protein